ncbi:phosphonate transport system ATP-binding protein [Microbacterium keratanolyticum]|uniref:phosphonate ABC transporter ATP-binding protein n=1 Tax=Microbacterium keratanolyticum TaxID=67574 RepID=UPI00195CD101|nr:phosphonate ABC transporter ATP-binding protein [Microbacterium keratanolyticum]MBM7468177.1 phosphonate transport system ATP-binding protein [Microbacterium keratanolyticum]
MPHAADTVGASASAAAPTPWSITLDDVTVRYPNGTVGLKNVSLDIPSGSMVAVVGLSGSGKSTLIRTINGLVPVTSGTLDVGEHRVSGASTRQLRRLRGDIGMVFQGFNLAGRASVLQNVLVGRLAHTSLWRTLLGAYSESDRQLAYRALESVGILPKLYARASELSGGQQQRVAIARALTQQPAIVLADEPVASLDPPTAHGVMADLRRINHDLGITVLVNLHLLDLAREYGVRMIGMRAGEVVYDGPAASASDADFESIYGRSISPEDRLRA